MDYKKAFFSQLEDCYLGVKVKDFHKKDLLEAQNSATRTGEIQVGEATPGADEARNTTQPGANATPDEATPDATQPHATLTTARKNGFSNLMQIKYKYFRHIKEYLEKEVEAQVDKLDSSEIYNKLYTFFESYLNGTGTPFFNDTPIYKNIYARIYSNSKDTSLFYKTQNLYYIKSDTLYQSLILSDETGENEVIFDTTQMIQNPDNAKNKPIFKFESVIKNAEANKTQILIKITNQDSLFPELFKVFKQNSNEFSDDFLKALKNENVKISQDELKRIFTSYKKQQEIDFFIHKDAKGFLEEQFDLWLFNHIYKEESPTHWNEHSVRRLQNLRKLAFETIKLIAKFENELKAIWLKPKFAKKTHYVFSLDCFKDSKKDLKTLLLFLEKNDKEGLEAQMKEWIKLGILDSKKDITELLNEEKYSFLPLDTKHFSKEARYEILSSFENLEAVLNGELIKSDNFQALNTLMPKYKAKVDLIYIDPPYNTGNDGFIYADDFNHSSWLTMMKNRLEFAREILSKKGVIFISIDDKEQANLKLLCDEVFGEENFIACSPRKTGAGAAAKRSDYVLRKPYDFILMYGKNREQVYFNKIIKGQKEYKFSDEYGDYDLGVFQATGSDATKEARPNLYYPIYVNKDNTLSLEKNSNTILELLPNKIKNEDGRWMWNKDKFLRDKDKYLYFDGSKINRKIYFNSNEDQNIYQVEKAYFDDVEFQNSKGTKEVQALFGYDMFSNPKPEFLIKKLIEISTQENNLVLDFFAGSGTTLAVAQKLGRKYLGVEMGEHFYSVVLPRMKKVIFGEQSGISKAVDYKGGGAFCYYELESYEEALSACEYALDENGIFDYKKSRKLIKNLAKGENINLDMSDEYRKEFDIFVSFANLSGLKIKRLFLDSGVETCEFDNGEILKLNELNLKSYPKLKNLIYWESKE